MIFTHTQRGFRRSVAVAMEDENAGATGAQPSYEGPRVNGRMEGYGKYTFATGTVYNGQFLDGQFHGEVCV